jgi:hypothetical protein
LLLAVVIVAEWYRAHLDHKIPVILLSDTPIEVDTMNGVTVMTMTEYGLDNNKIKEMLDNMIEDTNESNLFEEVNFMNQNINHKVFTN